MPTVLVTGANRGLGLEFVKQYAAEGWRVIATCRDPDEAEELKAVEGEVEIEKLDVADREALDSFAARLDGPLDLLILNAGVGRADPLTAEKWLHVLAVNAVAPTLIARALAGKMAEGAKIAAITSKMGSIADNGSGGGYAYRSSKAALNAAMKSLAIDLKPRGIPVLLLHPGWVRTRMGGPNGLIDPPESIAGMRRRIEELTLESSGRFSDYKGEEIPW